MPDPDIGCALHWQIRIRAMQKSCRRTPLPAMTCDAMCCRRGGRADIANFPDADCGEYPLTPDTTVCPSCHEGPEWGHEGTALCAG
ncbi:MAG TPA: hypothetical protein VMF86_08945 [Stellaceae bacterium]|nr:hypothetical protein [Stellaceae bacterium]